MKKSMVRAAALVAAVASVLGGASVANAAGSYSGTVTGVFENPVLSGNVVATDGSLVAYDNSSTAVTTGFPSSHVTWGSTPGFSQLIFLGDSFNDVAPGQLFHLGTIIYSNGTSDLSTLIFGAQLDLSTGGVTDDHVSNLSIVTTANTGLGAARDSDFIGFSDFSDTFNVYEGDTASIELFGRIVGDPMLTFEHIELSPVTVGSGFIGSGVGSVPEPATWAMLLTGLAGLGMTLRRRRPARAAA